MKNKIVNTIVLANLLALILLVIFLPQLMIEPGKLMDPHLDLTDDCFACHTPFIGSRPSKCMACHKVEDIGLKTTKGEIIAKEEKNTAFHQGLIDNDCVACHSDHKGVQSFRPIGQFSHQLIARETQEQCDSCHSKPGDALHQKTKGNCAECHTTEGWTPATLKHDEYFRFDRDHNTTCDKCHIKDDYSSYTCYGCHEHSRANIRGEHREEGIRDYENCVECHRSGDEDEAKYIWRNKLRGTRGQAGEQQYYRREHDDDDDDD